MARWQRHLRLQPEWGQSLEEGDADTRCALAAAIAKKLRGLRPFGEAFDDLNERRDELADWFDDLARMDEGVEQFDSAMEELYDWGDTAMDDQWNGAKCCWVDTFATV